MSAYNLYLLDETRDPKVIARLARVTGLAEAIVRRELRNAPFLVLKEHGLSQAVAIRRDFEQMGLTLRLELVENPSGDHRHPLADEVAPDGGAEIILEEGSGFTNQGSGRDVPSSRPAGQGSGLAHPLVRRVGLGLALLVLAFAGWFLLRGMDKDIPERDLTRELEQNAPQLSERLDLALRDLRVEPAAAESLVGAVDEMVRRTRPIWSQLSRKRRAEVERLLAMRETLVLRLSAAAGSTVKDAQWSTTDIKQTSPSGSGAEDFWRMLAVQWGRTTAPTSLGEQLALERMNREAVALTRGNDPVARGKLEQLRRSDPAGMDRLGARTIAGSLRQKGVVWTGEGAARQGWADLPDSTALDVEERGGPSHRARVIDGRLIFDEAPEEMQSVSVRLAALDRQPKGVQRILEAGLKLFAPEIYFATLPGSGLPRLNMAQAASDWAMGGDPALKEALQGIGFKGGDVLHPVLEHDQQVDDAELASWLEEAGAHYRKSRVWPTRLELRTPAGRYTVSGCELWLLTRPAA